MMDCEKIGIMISRDLDRSLPWHQRLSMRLHLVMCKLCREFEKHLRLIRRVSRAAGEAGPESLLARGGVVDASLSPDAKARLKATLNQRR